MASLTIAIDPAILEAARLEAERRQTSLDQMVSDYLATVVDTVQTSAVEDISREREKDRKELLEMMYSSPLGDIDRPLTREEIYAERTWSRS